jgi:hypothetical protein
VIAFNRPHLTRRTMTAIRRARPTQLFVIADGPRPDRAGDRALCAETRTALREIDWPCEVHERFAEKNLGCEASVELGLDWVFGQVGRALVIEDDCVPDPSFFRFAEELLERYAHDPRVWHIAGNRHGVRPAAFGGDSYAFSTWASVWGWATWADRWQAHRALFPRDHAHGDLPVRTRPATAREGTLVTRSGARHFAQAANSADTITHGWDKHWWLTIMSQAGLSVTPATNLVTNIGFGADATHTTAHGRRDDEAQSLSFPLRHPAQVTLDIEVERELELMLNRVGGRAARVSRRMVRSPMLRRILRKAVNSQPTTAAARTVSRLTQRRTRS